MPKSKRTKTTASHSAIPIGMSRQELVEMAQHAAGKIKGVRAVVILTDAEGIFVGVGMNTFLEDAMRIIECALTAEEQKFHPSRQKS
jgi:hypothetical protein